MPSIGSLFATIGLRAENYERGMKRCEKLTQAFRAEYIKLASITAVAGFMKSSAAGALEFASGIKDAAESTGTGIEQFQVLADVARQNGSDQEAMAQGLIKVASAAQDAAAKAGPMREALNRLGLASADFARLSPDQQIVEIARALQRAKDPAKAFADVSAILGEKVAPKLRAALQDLAENGYAAVAKRAMESGRVLDADSVKRTEAAKQSLENFMTYLQVKAGEAVAYWANVLGGSGPKGAAEQAKAVTESYAAMQAAMVRMQSVVAQRAQDGNGVANSVELLKSGARAALAAESFINTALEDPKTADFSKVEAAFSRIVAIRREITKNDTIDYKLWGRIQEARAGVAKASADAEAQAARDREQALRAQAEKDEAMAAKRKEFLSKIDEQNGKAREKFDAESRDRRVKREDEEYKTRLSMAEKYQRAVEAILSPNDYQRRGLQLGAARPGLFDFSGPSQLPAAYVSPRPAMLKTDNAGREDAKVVPQILRSIDATLKGIERKENALA